MHGAGVLGIFDLLCIALEFLYWVCLMHSVGVPTLGFLMSIALEFLCRVLFDSIALEFLRWV